MTYYPPESVYLLLDVVGPVEVSTIAEYRGRTVSHHETAVRVPGRDWAVVKTYAPELPPAELQAEHSALVAALSALWCAS